MGSTKTSLIRALGRSRVTGVLCAVVVISAALIGFVGGPEVASASSRATGSPLTFGVVATNTGGGPEDLPWEGQAIQAYAAYWNSQGGYKGHRIVVNVVDAGFSPTTAADAARQLVAQDNVLALVDNYDFFDCTVNNAYYASIPIAVVNSESTTPCFKRSVNFNLANPGGTIDNSALVAWAFSHGAKKMGSIGPSIAGLQGVLASVNAFVKRSGHPGLVEESVPLLATAADFDGAIAALKAAHVDSVLSYSLNPTLIQEANRQGYGPANGIKWMAPGVSSQTPAAAMPGAFALSLTYPFGTKQPGIADATKILKAGHVSQLNELSGAGYQSMIELRAALDTIKGPVTRASVLNALRHLTSFKVPLTSLTVDPANPLKNPEGGEVLEAKHGQWVPISPWITVAHP